MSLPDTPSPDPQPRADRLDAGAITPGRLLGTVLLFVVLATAAGAATTPTPTPTSALSLTVDAAGSGWALEPIFGLGVLTGTWEQADLDANLFTNVRPNMWRFYDLNFSALFPATLLPPGTPTATQWAFFDSEIRSIARRIKVVRDAGATVGVDPDRMPRWLSSCAENEGTLPQFTWESPLWANCAPIDDAQWSALVQRTVGIFAEEGVADFYWGVWNEPEWTFYGTEAEYLDFYRTTARAVRMANPQARVGGTNDVNLMVRKWQYAKHNPVVDYGSLVRAPEPLMKRLLEVAGQEQLPLDFVDWHFPTTDPRSDALDTQVRQAKDWLTASGLDENTPIRIGEWTVSACGQETAGELSAAYVVAMLKEMARLGISFHNHTSMRDQDGWADQCWSHVGLFSRQDNHPVGVARAKFNAFRLVSRLLPERLPAAGDDAFVDAVATADPTSGTLAVLVANYVNPSPGRIYQMVRDELIDRGVATPGELAAFDACVAQQRELGADLEAAFTYCVSHLPPAQQQAIAPVVTEIQAWIEERKTTPQTITLSISGVTGGAYDQTRYAIDWEHGNSCRYNKRTEPIPSSLACGEGGAVDQRWARVQTTAEGAFADELRRRNWTVNDLTVVEAGLLATCQPETEQGLDAFTACVDQWFLDHPDSFSKPAAQATADFWAAVAIYRQAIATEERQAAAELNAAPEVGIGPVEQRRVIPAAGRLDVQVPLIPNGVALVELTPAAAASTWLHGGRTLRMSDRSGRRRLAVTSADPGMVVPSPSDPAAPSAGGAVLEIVNPTTGERDAFTLPAANWKGLGNPAGSKGYRYADSAGAAGPCKTVVIQNGKRLRARCQGAGIDFSLDEAAQGGLGVKLTIGNGDRYCMAFGGIISKDEPGTFKAADAPAPAACP